MPSAAMRVPATDLGTRLPDLLRHIRAGETVTIVDGDSPVARLVAPDVRPLGLLGDAWHVPEDAFSEEADRAAAAALGA